MDLSQRKLTKQEWEGIEVPVSPQEKLVLKMIREGFTNINIRDNRNQSLQTFAKLEKSDAMEYHIFTKHIQPKMEKPYKKLGLKFLKKQGGGKLAPKKRDLIRLENMEKSLETHKSKLYEFTVLELIEKMLTRIYKNKHKGMMY